MISIFLREWKRLIKQPKVMITSFLMPSLLIIIMMALLFSGIMEKEEQSVAVITTSEKLEQFVLKQEKFDAYEVHEKMDEELETLYDKGKIGLILQVDLEKGSITCKYDSTKITSNQTLITAQEFVNELAIYLEDETLYELYIAKQLPIIEQDLSTAAQKGEQKLNTMVSIFTAVLVFLVGQPIVTCALDAYVGERERGTYDSIRLSGVEILRFILGKILHIASVGILACVIQMVTLLIGIKYFIGDMGIQYCIQNKVFMVVTIVMTGLISLLILIAAMVYLSTYFNTLKEASMYASIGILGFTLLTQLSNVVDSSILDYIPLVNMNKIILSSASGTEGLGALIVSVIIGIIVIFVLTQMSVMKLKAKEQ